MPVFVSPVVKDEVTVHVAVALDEFSTQSPPPLDVPDPDPVPAGCCALTGLGVIAMNAADPPARSADDSRRMVRPTTAAPIFC